ncbi:MAG: DUF4945 domain-containing protein [Anditalea sp.]
MKNLIFYIFTFCIILSTGCNRDEIIPSKPGEALYPVEDLQYAIDDSNVILTWQLPSSFSDEIIQPVSVLVRISIDGQNAGTHVLQSAPESYSYSPYDPLKEYRFTVKVMGDVDTVDPHVSDLRYSLGKTVAF